jgi:outer membrane protein
MNRVLAILPAVILLAPGAAPASDESASPPPVVTLTVDEAVEQALAASPRLAHFAALRTSAEAQEREARAERWPQVDLGAAYQRRSPVPELSIPAPNQDPAQPARLITIFPNIEDNYRLRAGLALPLYTGGRIGGQVEAAAQSVTAAEGDVRAARDDLVLEVKTAYWGLVTARESVRVLQEAMRAFDAHLEDARNRERFGLAARNEVLAVQVERDRSELDKLQAQTEADLAEANLRRLLDLVPSTRIEATEPLSTSAPGASDVEALVAEAAAARPDRAALSARVAAAQALSGAAHGARLPQLALTGGYTYANPNRDIVPPLARWQDTWDVGVSLSWSVFDGGRRSASEARARAESDAAHARLRELDRAIRLEVTQRALELRTAEARLAVAERSLESAKENRKVASDRYREGVIPSSDLLDAEVALERAALQRTEAQALVRLSLAALDRAVGR